MWTERSEREDGHVVAKHRIEEEMMLRQDDDKDVDRTRGSFHLSAEKRYYFVSLRWYLCFFLRFYSFALRNFVLSILAFLFCCNNDDFVSFVSISLPFATFLLFSSYSIQNDLWIMLLCCVLFAALGAPFGCGWEASLCIIMNSDCKNEHTQWEQREGNGWKM